MESIQRRQYFLSVLGLVLFAALSAGRDVVAKELFSKSRMEPVFATFFISLVSWIIFYITASVSRRGVYLFDDFGRAPKWMKQLIYLSNVITLVGFLTALMAIEKTNAYVNGLIDYGASPIITALLAVLILGERVSTGVFLGLIMSAIGVIILVTGLFNGTDNSISQGNSILGTSYAVVSAVAFGFNQLINKKLVDYGFVRDKVWLVRLPLIVVVLGIWASIKGMPNLDSWPLLFAWAAVGTTAPLFLLVFAFEHLRVANIASFLFLIPLFAFIGSVAFGHFKGSSGMLAVYLVSGLFVLAGVAITERSSYEADKG